MTSNLAEVAGERQEIIMRPEHRQFRVYNVGIAKTGTRSVAGIFCRYRSLHELLFEDTVQAVADHERGAMSEEEFRAFIRWRDELTRLDVDSSSYNCYYIDVLAQEFPDAKFLFVTRDCFSWLDSFLNMVMRGGPEMPEWMVRYIRRFIGPGFERELGKRPTELQQRLPEMIESAWRYWSTWNRFVLDQLPHERSLLIQTRRLSQSLPALASFVGVPEETLMPTMSYLHRAEEHLELVRSSDRALLSDLFEAHCVDVMQELFPDVTLEGYLKREALSTR